MRVIILRPRADERAFIVVVVLISDVPVEPLIQFDCQPGFRRLETHRIGRDQCSGTSGGIRQTRTLARVLINSICRIQRHARVEAGNRIDKEEMVPHEILAATKRVTHAIEEILKHRIVVDPMIVVASANETLDVGAQSIEEVNRRD